MIETKKMIMDSILQSIDQINSQRREVLDIIKRDMRYAMDKAAKASPFAKMYINGRVYDAPVNTTQNPDTNYTTDQPTSKVRMKEILQDPVSHLSLSPRVTVM